MKKNVLYNICLIVLPTFLLLNGCATPLDWVAERILANAAKEDDRETPPTPYAIRSSADETQIIGGQGKGLSCSLPLGANWWGFQRADNAAPISLQMRQVCAFHDFCYRHGNATYGYSQADCDFTLQKQAFRLCKQTYKAYSTAECETNARKVTLGVRVGGAGSFKRADDEDENKISTFFEFDPYPGPTLFYTVVRVADTPLAWKHKNVLPKSAYFFDIKPSGTRVTVLGRRQTGEKICGAFITPANFNNMNGPPMVVRDTRESEDWFVWWQRQDLKNTKGHFALLPPGRATKEDWEKVSEGFEKLSYKNCDEAIVAADTKSDSPLPMLSAFTFAPEKAIFSEIHPARDITQDGILRLVGITTHSCEGEKKDTSNCIVDVKLNLNSHGGTHSQLTMHSINDPINRYRNFVTPPYILSDNNEPYLFWLRRGTFDGKNYENQSDVWGFSLNANSGKAKPLVLEKKILADFSEDMEPAAMLYGDTLEPLFLSLLEGAKPKDPITLMIHTPVDTATQNGARAHETLQCPGLASIETSWLSRPPVLARHHQDPIYYLIMSRLKSHLNDFNVVSVEELRPPQLEIKVVTIQNNKCFDIRDQSAPIPLESFFSDEEKESIREKFSCRDNAHSKFCKEDEPRERVVQHAHDIFDSFILRARTSQLVVADLNKDNVPDILIAETKWPSPMRGQGKGVAPKAVWLHGTTTKSGSLNFVEF